MFNFKDARPHNANPVPDKRRPRPLAFGWTGYFVFLFVYRCLFSVIAELFVLRFTSISDTGSYQQGVVFGLGRIDVLSTAFIFDLTSTQFSTYLTAKIGGFLNSVLFGSPILIDIGFQCIAYLGLLYLLLSVEGQARRILAVLVLLPSFSVWSSIASKEAIVVFGMGILTGYLLRMYRGKSTISILPIIAAAIIMLYKPYYLIALAFAIIGTWFCSHVRQKAFLALIGGLASLILLYVFRDAVDQLAFHVQRLFSFETLHGRSSRVEPFFVEQYDVFLKAPSGMLLAFFGPKITEVLVSPLALVTFLESVVLAAMLSYLFFKRFIYLPAYSLIIGAFTLFWIMFPSYPFAVMNVGTAIRYRTGWLLLLFGVVAVLMSRDLFIRWQNAPSNSRFGLRKIRNWSIRFHG